jgi:HEAT repeat protein
MAASDDAEVARTARLGLGNFTGREAEAPIIGMLQSKNGTARVAAAELVAYRKMTGAMPQLLLGANDADAAVAAASLKALGDIGGNAEAPALIRILTGGANAQAAENALATIYSRSGEGAITDAVIAAMPAAPTPAKISLLRVLRRVGGPKGLTAIRTAMNDTNAEVRENAIRNLTDWPTAEALPELLALAKTPPTPAMKILALRGSLRLVPLQSGTPDQKMGALKEAMTLVERPEEKRLALSALSGVPTAESLALVMQELTNPALKQEASIAAVAIGEQLIKTQPDVVLKAMESVMTATEDKNLRNRAQALLRQKPQ